MQNLHSRISYIAMVQTCAIAIYGTYKLCDAIKCRKTQMADGKNSIEKSGFWPN